MLALGSCIRTNPSANAGVGIHCSVSLYRATGMQYVNPMSNHTCPQIAGYRGLVQWVQDGGVLAVTSGAAVADAYNDPVDVLVRACS